jgi:hypothetical protein
MEIDGQRVAYSRGINPADLRALLAAHNAPLSWWDRVLMMVARMVLRQKG